MAMYEGNWKCSGCGGAITQLPFQPRSESGLTCRSCYGKNKDLAAANAPAPGVTTATDVPDIPEEAGFATEPPPLDDAFAGMEELQETAPAEKPKYSGNWSCSGCGNAITSLPFEPRNTSNLKCLDCFKANK